MALKADTIVSAYYAIFFRLILRSQFPEVYAAKQTLDTAKLTQRERAALEAREKQSKVRLAPLDFHLKSLKRYAAMKKGPDDVLLASRDLMASYLEKMNEEDKEKLTGLRTLNVWMEGTLQDIESMLEILSDVGVE
jgi:hypothetical protein